MTIDARRIVYEQLDDASLRAIANLERLVLANAPTSEGNPAGAGSEAGEVQP
jgi:hypothetical protein